MKRREYIVMLLSIVTPLLRNVSTSKDNTPGGDPSERDEVEVTWPAPVSVRFCTPPRVPEKVNGGVIVALKGSSRVEDGVNVTAESIAVLRGRLEKAQSRSKVGSVENAALLCVGANAVLLPADTVAMLVVSPLNLLLFTQP